MIANRIEDYIRGKIPVSDEQLQLARAMGTARGKSEVEMFDGFFVKMGEDDPLRPKVSGSSPFYCPRRLVFKMRGQDEEPPAPRALNAWYMGRCVESMAQRQLVLSNPTVTWPKVIDGMVVEKTVTLDLGGHVLHGHVDAVVEYEGQEVPVEIKSHADYGFRQVAAKKVVSNTFGHLYQLTFYMAAMSVERGFYVAVAKSTGHVAEVEVHLEQRVLDEMRDGLDIAMTNHDAGMLPPYPAWMTTKVVKGKGKLQLENVRCTYCPYTEACHPGYVRETVGKRPVWRKPIEEASSE